MIYKIRIIADTQDDIFRDIEVEKDFDLEELHLCIVNAFSLESGQMASFYKTDDEWNQGEEISIESFNEEDKVMEDFKIHEILKNKNDRLLYVNDFLNMYTFYVELVEEKDAEVGVTYPMLVYEFGDERKVIEEKENNKETDTFEGIFSDDLEHNDDIFSGDDTFEENELY